MNRRIEAYFLGPAKPMTAAKERVCMKEGLWFGSPGTEDKKVFGEN